MKKTPRPENPNDRRNLSGVQFRYTAPVSKNDNYHELLAIAPHAEGRGSKPGQGLVVGRVMWNKKSGEVNWIRTHENYRGLGIASTLWDKANKLAADTGIKAPKHSRHRTEHGDKWAKAVGGDLPKITSCSACGDVGHSYADHENQG